MIDKTLSPKKLPLKNSRKLSKKKTEELRLYLILHNNNNNINNRKFLVPSNNLNNINNSNNPYIKLNNIKYPRISITNNCID